MQMHLSLVDTQCHWQSAPCGCKVPVMYTLHLRDYMYMHYRPGFEHWCQYSATHTARKVTEAILTHQMNWEFKPN